MSEPQPPSYESSSSPTDTSHPSEPQQREGPAATGTGIGERFMGAMGVIHGAGESVRGNVIGALDTLFGGKHEADAIRVAQRGREQMQSGKERMRGRSKEPRGMAAAAAGQPQPQEPVEHNQHREEQAMPQGQPIQQERPRPQAPVREPVPVQTKEPVRPQPEVSQPQPPGPVPSSQVKPEAPQPAPQTGEEVQTGAPSNAGAGRDEQKIPMTSLG